MSSQENGFQGSQPFVTDNEYKSLSLDQLRYILNQKKQTLKKSYKELSEKQKIIRDIRRLDKLNEKVNKGIDLKKKYKKKKTHSKKIKTFDQYFEECIKNKIIPEDTPFYFREALERAMIEYDQGIEKEKSALEDFTNKYVIEGTPATITEDYLDSKFKILKNFFTYHRNIKTKLVLICLMEKVTIQKNVGITNIEEDKAYFKSDTEINLESTNVKKMIKMLFTGIINSLENYASKGSGWTYKEPVKLEIHTVDYNPTKGSSYIPLPDWISNKKAIINIKNKDDKCFLWSILRYIHPRIKNEERINDLKNYELSLNTKGLTFPMDVNKISKFEKLNPKLPGINVFSVNDKKTIYPLRMADRDCKKTIDLFLFEEDDKSHYSLIKNFSRLIRSQITSRTDEPIQICKRCFSHYTKPELLEKHIKYCSNNATSVVEIPKPNTKLYFKNYHKQLPIPFVVYADFECFTKPMNTCSPNPKDSYNYNYQKHEPSGFCFYVKGIVDKKLNQLFIQKNQRMKTFPKYL